MSENNMQDLTALEEEFNAEVKGYGSLSVNLVSGENSDKLGYQIRPEDIESLYFEGIGTPRWESIKADSVDEQLKIYHETMGKIMEAYPLINRVNDTDKSVVYSVEELSHLLDECEKVVENTNDEKAKRAVQKFVIACIKGGDNQAAVHLNPG